MWVQVPTSKTYRTHVEHQPTFREPVPQPGLKPMGPEGIPRAGRDAGFRVHSHLAELSFLSSPSSHQGADPAPAPTPSRELESCTCPHLHGHPRGAAEPHNLLQSPFSLFRRCRRQPLCTVSNRTHYFSPPTRNSPGPWPTPRSPHPHAPLAGLAVCLSPQASSSHPGSASTPAGSHSALANGWMTQGGHGGLGGGFDPWLPCTLHTFQNS